MPLSRSLSRHRAGPSSASRFSTLDPTRQPLNLALVGTPGLGKNTTVQVRGGPAAGVRVLIAGIVPSEVALPFSPSRILMAGQILVMGSAAAGAGGAADISLVIPNAPVLVGESAYFQGWALNAGPWLGSVGLEIKFCK